MQAMNVKYEISLYMTRTKDVVSLSERKKERSEVSPKVEKRKSKGGGGGGGERGRRKGISLPNPSLILEKGSARVFSLRWSSPQGRTVHKLFPYLDLTTCENCENKKLFVREKKPVVYSEVKTKKNTTHHLVKSI